MRSVFSLFVLVTFFVASSMVFAKKAEMQRSPTIEDVVLSRLALEKRIKTDFSHVMNYMQQEVERINKVLKK